MLFWLSLIGLLLLLCFGVVIFFGPPYLPTLNGQIETALKLLDLQAGETLLELGSGDGRVMLAAAKKGLKVTGIELNPVLVVVSRIVTWRYRKQVRIIWGSYWSSLWPRADAIFAFMLPKYMTRLDKQIEKWVPKPVTLASFAFSIPGKEPVTKLKGVFLYKYREID
jgi:hypothetical protein